VAQLEKENAIQGGVLFKIRRVALDEVEVDF